MKKTFYISGMHCVSCELLIENKIKDELKGELKGAKIKASHISGRLKIEAPEINEEKIEEIVKSAGYSLKNSPSKDSENKKDKKDPKSFSDFILAFVIFAFLFFIISKFNLTRFFPDLNRDVSIFVALFIGLVASLSTCLAITGGLVMSLSSSVKLDSENYKNKSKLFLRTLPQVYFHIGRIGGFFIFGGLLGSLGGAIQYSSSLSGFLMILVALIMFYVALNLLGLLPSITKLGFYLPKSISKHIFNFGNKNQEGSHKNQEGASQEGANQNQNKPFFIGTLGALTFFLPCGFTQSMQMIAISSGGFLAGALIMSFFALGTLPVLFSVGLGSSYANQKKFGVLNKFIAIMIIFFALYSLNNGLNLYGSKYSVDFWNKLSFKIAEESVVNSDNGDYQEVQLDIDYTFLQRDFKIKKDVPVRFVINAIRVTGCSNEVVITRLGLKTGKLKNGDQAVLEFTPTEKGIIPFSCWMGMINGRFIVE